MNTCVHVIVSLFQFVENVAIKIPSKWIRVGVAFGLNRSQIDANEKRYLADDSVILMCSSTAKRHLLTSRASFVSVLHSNYVGEERLAEYIQETLSDIVVVLLCMIVDVWTE